MRTSPTLLLSAALAAPLFAVHHDARADGLEAGATAGGHVFSSNSELGVPDRMGGPSPQPSVLLGGRLGYAFLTNFAAELELFLIPTVDDAESRGALVFGARTQMRYQPFGDTLMGGKLHPFILAGYGFLAVRTDADQLKNDSDPALHWGLGTHYALTRSMDLRIDAKHLVVPDRSKDGATSNFEFTAGLTWRFGRSAGASTSSHTTVATAPEAAAAPSAPTSTGAAEIAAGPAGPGPAPAATPETDDDGDGLFGAQDACPTQAEDRDGFEDEDGCPDPDNDQDGIADANDRCPNEAEAANGYNDEDGCPEASHPDFGDILFARNSDGFSGEAAVQLDTAFRALQANVALRLELGGHSSTDESSKISLRRAQTVKDYFLRRGVAPERLRVLGYRAERPFTTDRNNKARNRRVVMRLLPLDPAPTTLVAPAAPGK
ncbi:MAG: OmpA family protein [Kofleriaceae bacterium]